MHQKTDLNHSYTASSSSVVLDLDYDKSTNSGHETVKNTSNGLTGSNITDPQDLSFLLWTLNALCVCVDKKDVE